MDFQNITQRKIKSMIARLHKNAELKPDLLSQAAACDGLIYTRKNGNVTQGNFPPFSQDQIKVHL